MGSTSDTWRNNWFTYVQYLQYLQEVLDLQQMHYVVIYTLLRNPRNFWSDGALNRVQRSSSDWAASQTEILDKHKENSNSTHAKILAGLKC